MTSDWSGWRTPVLALCDAIRERTRAALAGAADSRGGGALARPAAQGVGDVAYGLDLPAEACVDEWIEEVGRDRPISVLTEHAGWRHVGPDGGRARPLAGFDHGGPRIAFDPIDGTRNLMSDLRSAWTVVSFAPPGPSEPTLAELSAGLVAELPDTRAASYRIVEAERGGPCRIEQRRLRDRSLETERALVADADDRVDQGYFPFFRYAPELRVPIARAEAAFLRALAEKEGADAASCFDDQYICNAGQLVLLALGTYRVVADVRARAAASRGLATTTSKPYDLAGAVLCARAAGCVVTDPSGAELAFPIDATTPVAFLGYANRATAARLERHLLRALRELD